MAGWIKQWEVPDGHWLNEDLRYIGAWYGLIQMAEPKDKKIVKFGNMIEAKRGSVYTSMSELAKKWNVSRWWVRHFLEMLEADGMIDRQQTDSRLTTIIVRNYAKYQDKPNNRPTADRQVIVQQTDGSFTSRPTGEATSFLTNNTEGIDGTEGKKERVRTFVPPTVSDVVQYAHDAGLKIDAERFVNYYESNGWLIGGKSHMRNWQAAVRNWAAKEKPPNPSPKKFDNFEPRPDGDLMDDLIKQLEARYGT